MVAGVASATQLHRLRRKPEVSEGVTEFYGTQGKSVLDVYSSQWIVDTDISGDNLRSHTIYAKCSKSNKIHKKKKQYDRKIHDLMQSCRN
jgi:hypothetical protein